MTNVYSQFTPTVENIPIPSNDGGGSLIGDIVQADNRIFVYSMNKISVYSAQDNSFLTEIIFPNQPKYGKYNPIFYNELYHVSDISLMAHNPNSNTLYVVTPNLDVLLIDCGTLTISSNFTPQASDLPEYFKPLNGICILKFDHIHNRLYWVLTAKDINSTNNCIGSFHSKARFFAIYKTDNQGNIIRYYVEDIATSTIYEQANISDIEFNHENNLYYLSKISLLEIWEVTDYNGAPNKVELIHSETITPSNYNCNFYKFGKLIYVNEQYSASEKIHKIIALPYRFLDQPLDDPDVFMINGEIPSSSNYWETFPSPSKRILDGIFHAGTQQLILSYAPDPENLVPPPTSGNDLNDIAIFDYDFIDKEFIIPPTKYNTDLSTNYSDDHDINHSIKLHQTDNLCTLISKKDEIIKFTPSNSTSSSTQVYSGENNFFSKGVRNTINNKSFVLNLGSNGVVSIDDNYISTHIPTGFVANHCVSDDFGGKYYFYNKLNTYNSGCYIYDVTDPLNPTLNNINSFAIPGEELTTPIGDCVYNHYLDHFIISENHHKSNQNSCLLVFDNNQSNDLLYQIPLDFGNGSYTSYATKMFIGPNEKIYVFANMRLSPGSNPRLFVLSASNSGQYSAYQIINSFEINNMPIPNDNYNNTYDFLIAHFCYNHYNNRVYATLSPNEFIYEPYSTVPNSMYELPNSYEDPTGLLIRIEDDAIYSNQYNYPGKLICPNTGNDQLASQYHGKMFMIGSKIRVLNSLTDDISTEDEYFNDIIYNSQNDILLGLRDATGTCGPHRLIQVYDLIPDGNSVSASQILETEGQASCFFSNPYDGKIYLQKKYDAEKLGDYSVKLHYFEYSQNPTLQTIDLDITSVYPEIDHNGDFRLYLYNLLTPSINPYNNSMYIPNGGHSCVSKVTFEAKEPLYLEEGGWTWLSFPRMNRDNNDPVLIPTVLNANIEPETYETGSKLENIEIGSIVSKYCFYDSDQGWIPEEIGLQHIQSTLGYKLQLNYGTPPEQSILFMQGNLYDHFAAGCNNCLLNLTGASNNTYWVGYYYPVSQNIIDAIPDELEPYISVVKGQYYSCYAATHSDGSIQWTCAINKRPPVIGYGDMVEIVLLPGESISDYYWSIINNIPDEQERPGTEYFAYTETADYIPVFIELDTNQNPMEIAAFVNDSCIGASTVLPDDSVVLVPAYADSLSGEIYFEQYYGSLKSVPPPVTTYYVENQQTKIREQRLIHTSESKPYYIVSFKNKQEQAGSTANKALVSCSPNPIKDYAHLSFYIPEDSYIEIRLYNLMGMLQNKLFSGHTSAGTHNIDFELEDSNGQKLCNGSYIISMTSAKYQAQTKIVVIN